MSDKSDPSAFNESYRDGEVSRRAARGGGVVLASQATRFALQLVQTAILARLLSPEVYGLMGYLAIMIAFFHLVGNLGLSHATIQRDTLNQGQTSALFWINLAVGAALMAACAALGPFLEWTFDKPELRELAPVMGLGFLIAGAGVQHGALLARRLQFAAMAWITVAAAATSLVVGVVCALLGMEVWALVAAQLSNAAAITIGNWTCARWRPGRPRMVDGLGDMLRFGVDVTFNNLMAFFVQNTDKILIGLRADQASLGLYERSASIVLMPLRQINYPLYNVMTPSLSRLQEKPDEYARVYLRAVELIAMATMPPVAVAAVLAEPLVRVIFGASWIGATPIFFWLAVSMVAQPVGNSTGWLFVSQGRTRDQVRWATAAGLAIVCAFSIGIEWGAVGVACSYAIAHVGLTPIAIWYVTRKGPVRARAIAGACAPSALATCAAAAGAWLTLAAMPEAAAPIQVAAPSLLGGACAVSAYLAMARSRAALLSSLAQARTTLGEFRTALKRMRHA